MAALEEAEKAKAVFKVWQKQKRARQVTSCCLRAKKRSFALYFNVGIYGIGTLFVDAFCLLSNGFFAFGGGGRVWWGWGTAGGEAPVSVAAGPPSALVVGTLGRAQKC